MWYVIGDERREMEDGEDDDDEILDLGIAD